MLKRVLLGFLLVCGLSAAAPAQEPKMGGVINTVIQPEPPGLMLAMIQNGPTQMVAGNIFEGLVRLAPDDLLSERWYQGFRAYAMSKHMVQGFALELDRRLRAAGSQRMSLLAHPGFAVSGLAPRRAGISEQSRAKRVSEIVLFSFVGQGKDAGAWPSVRAATDPDAVGGTFYGPSFATLRGLPAPLAPVASSASPAFGAQLWGLAEELTGVRFDPAR